MYYIWITSVARQVKVMGTDGFIAGGEKGLKKKALSMSFKFSVTEAVHRRLHEKGK